VVCRWRGWVPWSPGGARDLAARRVFETLAITGVLATCAVVELEILYSAQPD
jgi:hypothetical protein